MNFYDTLTILARSALESEQMRIATDARIDDLLRRGLSELAPEITALREIREPQRRAELRAKRSVEAHMRNSALASWVGAIPGIGFPSIGLFLGTLGDPLWNQTEERPRRGFQELVAYCGMNPVNGRARRRRQGVKDDAGGLRRALLIGRIATSARNQGHYREVYLEAKERYRGTVHTHECINRIPPRQDGRPRGSDGCGTRAHPEWGAIGSQLRDGHVDARALRLTARTFLRDLYNEAKRVSA